MAWIKIKAAACNFSEGFTGVSDLSRPSAFVASRRFLPGNNPLLENVIISTRMKCLCVGETVPWKQKVQGPGLTSGLQNLIFYLYIMLSSLMCEVLSLDDDQEPDFWRLSTRKYFEYRMNSTRLIKHSETFFRNPSEICISSDSWVLGNILQTKALRNWLFSGGQLKLETQRWGIYQTWLNE